MSLVHPIEAHSEFIDAHIHFFHVLLTFLKVDVEIHVSCLGSLNATEQNINIPASHNCVLVAPVVNLVHVAYNIVYRDVFKSFFVKLIFRI